MVRGKASIDAVELSALRQPELAPLPGSLDRLDLRAFVYVSLHAPSRMSREEELARIIREVEEI